MSATIDSAASTDLPPPLEGRQPSDPWQPSPEPSRESAGGKRAHLRKPLHLHAIANTVPLLRSKYCERYKSPLIPSRKRHDSRHTSNVRQSHCLHPDANEDRNLRLPPKGLYEAQRHKCKSLIRATLPRPYEL